MKTLLIAAVLLGVAAPAAAGCITTAGGRTICRNAAGQVTTTGAAVDTAAVVPGAAVGPRAVGAQTYSSGVATVHGAAGGAAAYNPRTGNAAVSHTNAYGVRTTQTARGGEAVTKDGMGVARGPGGTTCAKGRGRARCD